MRGGLSVCGRQTRAIEITALLDAWSAGNQQALDLLIPRVYGALRRLASKKLRCERSAHTLETTGLLHETYLRLTCQHRTVWRSRAQFFAVAARLMRRILVDYARARAAKKRDSQAYALELHVEGESRDDSPDVLGLDDALHQLARLDPDLCQLVELRFFGGMTHEEIAAVRGVSVPTVARRWRQARAWLFHRLHEQN